MRQKNIIKKLKSQNAAAQKELYEEYAPKFLALCMRYMKDKELAENAMMEGFMKIFTEIKKYRDIGSFQAWMYKIMVNQCLMELRKKHNFNVHLNTELHESITFDSALDHLYKKDLLDLINQIPTGCKTVFNLYIIEGYSHKEIAYKLQISEGTSKSQLNLAKKKIKELLHQQFQNEGHGR